MDLQPEDVDSLEEEGEENRYDSWRSHFEALFDHAKRSTFQPLTDNEIASDLPWKKTLKRFLWQDPTDRVDLRCPSGTTRQVIPTWQMAQPRTTIPDVTDHDMQVD